MSPHKKKDTTTPTFEESLRRLEEIVDQLEQGDISLDESLKIYEEGIALSRACVEKLTQAELRLKTLGKDMQGSLRLTDDEEPGEG